MRNYVFLLAIAAFAAMAFFWISPEGKTVSVEASSGTARGLVGSEVGEDLPASTLLSKGDGSPAAQFPEQDAGAASAAAVADLPTDDSTKSLLGRLPEPQLCPPELDSAGAAHWQRERLDTLNQLSGQKEPEAMFELLAELGNPDESIRTVALKSLEFMRDRAAIPYLEAIVEEAEGAKLRADCLELIDFLQLETLTEFMERTRVE